MSRENAQLEDVSFAELSRGMNGAALIAEIGDVATWALVAATILLAELGWRIHISVTVARIRSDTRDLSRVKRDVQRHAIRLSSLRARVRGLLRARGPRG